MLSQRKHPPPPTTFREAVEIVNKISTGDVAYYNATRLVHPQVLHDSQMGYILVHDTQIPSGIDVPDRILLNDEHLIVVKPEP